MTTVAHAESRDLMPYLGKVAAASCLLLFSTQIDPYPAPRRTFVAAPNWADLLGHTAGSAVSDTAPLVIGEPRAEDASVAELASYLELSEGWDGENAARPNIDAVLDAIRFLRLTGAPLVELEPTPHADGSVLLEINSGADGSLRFRGDGKVVYQIAGHPFGVASLDSEMPSSLVAMFPG